MPVAGDHMLPMRPHIESESPPPSMTTVEIDLAGDSLSTFGVKPCAATCPSPG
jgi:hypothetical protein